MADADLTELDLQGEGSPKMTQEKGEPRSKSAAILVMVLIVVAGGFSGFFLAKIKSRGEFKLAGGGEIPQVVTKGQVVGSTDTETFRDQAAGRLEKNGGDDQEGTHKLIREGGPDQTAFLISSVVDLDQYVGHQVEIWGETFYSDKVGWLMDVGRLKVLD